MTVSETEDASEGGKEEHKSMTHNEKMGPDRRSGVCDNGSSQISQSKITTNYSTSDIECDPDNSYWVETWLDEHPDFFQAYLIRKGTRSMIDSWLVSHALPPGITTTTLNNVDEEDIDDVINEDKVDSSKSSVSTKESTIALQSNHTNVSVQGEGCLVAGGVFSAGVGATGTGNKVIN